MVQVLSIVTLGVWIVTLTILARAVRDLKEAVANLRRIQAREWWRRETELHPYFDLDSK